MPSKKGTQTKPRGSITTPPGGGPGPQPIPPLPDHPPITTPPGGGPQPIPPLPGIGGAAYIEMMQTLADATAEEIAAAGIRNGMSPQQQYEAIKRVKGGAD